MDDFFQILIYLLIIISFIAPLFKKKNQQKKSQQQQRQMYPVQDDFEKPETNVTATETRQQDYVVLKELENFFKVGNVEETKKVNFVEPVEMVESKPQPEEEYQTKWEKKKAEVEKVVSLLDKKIEKQAEKFEEQFAHQQTQLTNKLVLQLKNNIRKPATLREYILFSEIIGKPKALRR